MCENNNDSLTKKRAGKTTSQQYQIIVQELKQNIAFKTNKNTPENPNAVQQTWVKLTGLLNAAGGPIRSTEAWKRVFVDWKSHVKRKARQYKINQNQTGGGPPLPPLNDLENQLLDAIGTVVIDGINNVQELGIPLENPPVLLDITNNDIQELGLQFEEPSTMDIVHFDNNVPIIPNNITPTTTEQAKRKTCTKKRGGIDSVVDAFMTQCNSNKEIVNELCGIKIEMRRSNKIKKFKVKLEYEKAKVSNPNLNLDRELDNLSEDSN